MKIRLRDSVPGPPSDPEDPLVGGAPAAQGRAAAGKGRMMAEPTDLSAAVVDALDDSLLVVGPDLAVVSCNRSFRKLAERLGHQSSPVGESVLEVVPFLSGTAAEDYKTVFNTGSSVVTEESAGLGDASVTAEVRKLPVWAGGKVVAVATVFHDVSRRRKAEDSLRLKDAAIELSASGIALCSLEGIVTYANRSLAAMWGSSNAGELTGMQFGALWQAREAAEGALASLQGRGAWSGELMARRRDGSVFGTHLSASIVRQEDGVPVCSMVVVSDVSERVGMEEALDESEAMLRTLLDMDPDAVFLADPEGRVLAANRAAAYAFDRPLEQVLGRVIPELLGREEGELVEAHREVAQRTGHTIRFEAGAGGRVFDYRICPASEGPVTGKTLAIFRQEVTERSNAQRALREVNRAQQALIGAAPFAIVEMSREGTVRLWNWTAERWFGWSEAEAVGYHFPAVPREQERAFRTILDRVSRGENMRVTITAGSKTEKCTRIALEGIAPGNTWYFDKVIVMPYVTPTFRVSTSPSYSNVSVNVLTYSGAFTNRIPIGSR